MEIHDYAKQQIDLIKEKCKSIKPLVVIRTVTYNHEPYIRDALEGFVMQKTTFPFVAIVHDDASTDKTGEIVKAYAEKYPDIIMPILEIENQYSKNDGNLGRIINTACEATGAKYVAMCEGDDYWTDPHKLQKQVDVMESDKSISMSFHTVLVNKDSSYVVRSKVSNRYYSGVEYFKKRPAQTASFIFRTEVLNSKLYREVIVSRVFSVGDIPLIMVCAKLGKLYGLSDMMSVYRPSPTGWTLSKKTKEEQWKLIKEQLEYGRFGKEFSNPSRMFAQDLSMVFFINNLKNKHIEYDFLKYSLKLSLYGTLKAAFKIIKRRLKS